MRTLKSRRGEPEFVASTNISVSSIKHRGDPASDGRYKRPIALASRLAGLVAVAMLLPAVTRPEPLTALATVTRAPEHSVPAPPPQPEHSVPVIEASHVPARYRSTVLAAASAYSVPPSLLSALIDQETGGTWDASIVNYNSNGTYDKGLSQANSAYHEYFAWRFGLADPEDGVQSIWFCAQYLRFLYDNGEGDWYNANIDYKQGLNDRRPEWKLVAVVVEILKEAGYE